MHNLLKSLLNTGVSIAKNFIVFVLLFFLTLSSGLAYSQDEVNNALVILTSAGDELTGSEKEAARILQAELQINPENVPEYIRDKLNGTCTTTYCGKGLREGLNFVKPELQGTGITTSDSIIRVILGLIEFSLPFAGLFAFVGIVYGGFLYVTSFAEDQTEKAQNILIWSVLGLIIIFVAYPLVATLIKFQS